MASSWESITVNDRGMDLYLSLPEGPGPFPAVVVAHHGAGVDDFTREMADRLAGEGYAAVAPDLFHRVTDDMLADGSRRFNHLSDPGIAADVDATVEYLRSNGAVNGEAIGVTGFCMGGRVTWLAACTNSYFNAAVPYYGGNIMVPRGEAIEAPFELAKGIGCPVLFHFGEIDANPSQDDMRKLDEELTRLGKPHKFYTYPGADHGFMDYTGSRYQKQASEVSWARTLNFFDKHLKGAAA